MMKTILLSSVLAFTTTAAAAQCLPREKLVMFLEAKHGETVVAKASTVVSLAGDNYTFAVEIWANEVTGKFSVVRTSAKGTSCLMLTGADFAIEPEGTESGEES